MNPGQDSNRSNAPVHFDGRRFRNPAGPAGRGFLHYVRWATSGQRQRWPKRLEINLRPPSPAPLPKETIAATFIGHATFLLQIGGFHLLTDPVYSERVGPFNRGGPRRVRAPAVPFEQLPHIDCVLLSHNHYDHADVATLLRLRQKSDPLIVTGLGNLRWLRKRGLARAIELDWWQEQRVLGGLEVVFTPAQHFSSRHVFDRDRTLWGGFVVRAGAQKIYFAGDSGYGDHFREIGRRAQPIDLALLPIGAYEPRWFMKHAHVDPEEAVRVHLELKPRQSIGMHFGTFQLTDEGIDEPPRALRQALRHHGVPSEKFIVPEFGQTVLVPPPK